eukprot:Em0009g1273a
MAALLGVVSIVVLLVCPTAIYCSNVTVSPFSSLPCSQPCGSNVNGTSIDQALGNINSGDYLRLLPGCHCVRTFSVVQDVTDVSLIGDGGGIVQITCAPGLGLAFLNVTRLSFQGLIITGCGLNGPNAVSLNTAINTMVDLFIQLAEDINIAMVIASCTDVVMDHVTIMNTTGLGLVGVNVAGESSFTNNVFSFNMGEQCFLLDDNYGMPKNWTVGGGAQFIYVDYVAQSNNSVDLNIDNNTFSKNSYCGSELIFEIEYQFIKTIQNISYYVGAGGGLSLSLAQRAYSVNTSVQRCSFENNTATIGSAVAILWYAGVQNTSIVLSDCVFSNNGIQGLKKNDVVFVTQGGLAIVKDIAVPFRLRPNLPPSGPNTVTVLRTNFTGNTGYSGSCVFVFSMYSTPFRLFDNRPNQVTLDGCHFENNSGIAGPIFLGGEEKATGLQSGLVVQMQRCTVVRNKVNQPLFGSTSSTLALVQLFAMNMTIRDTSFISNVGTAVGSLTSLIILEGVVDFANAMAVAGGALHLSTQTVLLVKNNSKVSFTNNTAYVGGAIYSDYSFGAFTDSNYNDCFMYFDDIIVLCTTSLVPCPDLSALNISVVFSNNKAYLGGILYGSSLDSCSWAADIKNKYCLNCPILEALYNLNENKTITVLQLDQRPNTSSVIATTTSALNVDNSPAFSYMPGQQFFLKLQSVDRLNHTVPTVVTAQSKGSSSTSAQLGGSGFWLTTANGSSDTPTKVYGQQNSTVSLTVYSLDSFVQSQSLRVSLGNCGFGFSYNMTSMDCECGNASMGSKVTCDPNLKVFNTTDGFWFGPGPNGVGVVYGRCLLDYCNGNVTGWVLTQAIDAQCANNRTGLLCGGCQEGYSSVFGTNRCMKCTDSTLGLLVFFAAAGIGIIAVILFLHITVSEGYITGVVFYSGVVVTYATVQGAAREALIPLYFLNLNIGFETCFYDGMTALDRAGLGLVFPAYLFILMILFIWLAGRFLLLSEWLAKSNFTPSKLVATLIVLSYNSITQSCFQILGFVEVTVYQDDGSSYVIRPWATDPNVEYFSPKHAVLFVISVVLLIIYVLPVTVLLILPSFTSRGVWRFKPLYDVFFNPFKDNFTFWLGVCLVIRIMIFTISSFFAPPGSTLYLGVVLMGAVFLKSVIQPFKLPVHNGLDVFFLINLLLLSISSLYFQGLDATNKTYRITNVQSPFTAFLMVLVGVAYVVICAVIVVHFYLRFPKLRCSCKARSKKPQSVLPEATASYKNWSVPETSAKANRPTPESQTATTKVTFSEFNTAGISDDLTE